MRKLNQVLVPLLLTSHKTLKASRRGLSLTLLLSTFFLSLGWQQLLTQTINAQTRSGGQSLSWQRIFQENEPPMGQTPGTQRGPVCSFPTIAGGTNISVWSDRPMFAWKGNLEKIGVRPRGQKVMWSQSVKATQGYIAYAGEPLQPGQIYQWVLLDNQDKPFAFAPFKMMDAQERDRIKADLAGLDEELKSKSATPEQIALQRANYFAQKGLWSDVLQEVHSVKTPSGELQAVLKAIPDQLCTTD